MSKLIIPADIMEKMVCLTCKNYLSLFPVYIRNDGSGAICGRCKVTDEDKYMRDVAYENIAQFLMFPCCYKNAGCNEQQTPPKITDHEKSCSYRKVECSTKGYTKCQWQGAYIDLKTHFGERHSDLILENAQFELNFASSQKGVAIMSSPDDEIFIIKKEVDSCAENFTCSVQHLKSSETAGQYDYVLRLTNGDKTHSCKLPQRSTVEGSNTVKFSYDFVREKLNDATSVIVTVGIVEANSTVLEEEAPETELEIKKDPNINWDLLNELECPICFDFMLPPIYQCVNGHSICSECKPKINACSICKSVIQDTRNFVLEKMTQFLTFPCKYYKSGCKYSSKTAEIRAHEERCDFGPYECPLKEVENCQSKSNISEIVNHVNNNHSTFILNSDKINVPFDKNEAKEQICLIKFSEKLFKLYYKYADNKFFWSLQLIGPTSECKKFKFEIDVVDNSRNDLRCYLRGLCVAVTDKANSFNDPRKYLMLILDQIEPLITDTLSYRVRVIKE